MGPTWPQAEGFILGVGAQMFFKGTGEVGEVFKATGGGGGADACALLDESAGLGAADKLWQDYLLYFR